MCFDDDGQPPAFPGVVRGTEQSDLVLTAADGGAYRAVLARPTASMPADPDSAVLILPDGRGLHPYYERMAARLASVGIPALAIDTYGRTAGIGARPADFTPGDHSAALRWETVQLDLAAGVTQLRATLPGRPLVTMGFCLGGRIALLAATVPALGLAGTIAFYPGVHGPARSDLPAPDDVAGTLCCPVLSLFGGADELIPPEHVDAWQAALSTSPMPGDVVVYPGAPHSFFDRRADDFTEESDDAAARCLAFLNNPG